MPPPKTPTSAEAPAVSADNPFRRAMDKVRDRGPRPASPRQTTGKRNSLAEGFGMVWGVGGGALSMRGDPAGRVMRVQAPMAGREFDRWVKRHPVVDAIFQPLLGADGLDFVSKVILPPLFVHVCWARPEMIPLIEPVLMPMLYKVFVEVNREQHKMQEALAEVTADEIDGGAEFAAFLEALGLTGSAPPQPEETGYAEGEDVEGPMDGGPDIGEGPDTLDDSPNGEVAEDFSAFVVGPPTRPADTQVG